VRLSEILGSRVTTVSGKSLGHVFDVRGELGPETLRVTGLVVGRLGLLERLGIGTPGRRERLRTDDVIPWGRVVSATSRAVVVRDEAA
jgi:sporulation protein YlmC with PRC-barrel domain